ncbi:13738_t:CDS:2, partial [Dentiscutata erythropus]
MANIDNIKQELNEAKEGYVQAVKKIEEVKLKLDNLKRGRVKEGYEGEKEELENEKEMLVNEKKSYEERRANWDALYQEELKILMRKEEEELKTLRRKEEERKDIS